MITQTIQYNPKINLAHYAAALVLASRIDALLQMGYHLLTTDGRRIFHFDQALKEIDDGYLCSLPNSSMQEFP